MNNNTPKKENGAALLVLFLIIFTVSSTVLLAGLNNNAPNLQRETNIREEMALAKEALLAYAVNYQALYPASTDGPGRFPCADSIDLINTPINIGDGSEDCPTSGPARLPDLPSGSPYQLASTYLKFDRKFWYYISPSYVRDAGTAVNSSTVGGYTIDTQSDDIIAVIISPGEQLSWQDRLTGSSSVSNYLEEDNQSGTSFFNADPDPDPDPDPDNPNKFNDHVLGISHSELMSSVTVMVAQEIEIGLDNYYSNYDWRCSSTFVLCGPPTWEGWSREFSYPRDGIFWTGFSVVEHTKEERFSIAMSGVGIESWFDSDDWDLVTNYTYNSSTSSSFTFDNCSRTFSLVVGSNVTTDQGNC